MKQRTLAEKVSCTGIGLHTGVPAQLTLRPAAADTGIVFVRRDGPDEVEIPARPEFVASTSYATTLGAQGATVSTVEHLLAALYGLGIDNARVEVEGPEIPIMDGSAAPFAFMIRSAGVFEQRSSREPLYIRRPIEVRDGARSIRVEPCQTFRVSYEVDYDHPCIGRQELRSLELVNGCFEKEISRARTFGFLHEVQALWRAGLARGGNLENTVVLDDRRVLNPDGLRWNDEFVRHKVLDLMGDLALVGTRLRAHVHVLRGGHALHQRLVSEILSSPEAEELGPVRVDWRPDAVAVPA